MKIKSKSFYMTIFFVMLVKFSVYSQEKPKAYIVSNAHFDTQWNWDVQTSISQYAGNTVNQNLFLLDKYPNYVFNFEGGIKYSWMKEYYPEQFKRVKDYIKKGSWHVSGSTWDATDANIPSPESFIRNVLYGQQFYKNEFGVKSTDIFLPDCFGFGWQLPTLAAHCGLIGFSTQKLYWRQNPFYGNSKIPFEIGLWKGVDGSKIMLVAQGRNYVTKWKDEDLSQNEELIKLATTSPLNLTYHYYGTGDMGGSPTLESVRAVEKGVKGNGPIQIISAPSDQLYKDFLPFDKHPELPEFTGELLMDVHGTGCYTSQAAMKLYNRKNELTGDAAERAAVIADWSGGLKYPQRTLDESWKRFIWHQFHDDLTGTSIPRAYEFSWNDELLSQKQFAQVLTTSTGTVSKGLDTNTKGIPFVIYNALSQFAKDVVEVNVKMKKEVRQVSVYNEKGTEVPAQLISYKDGVAKILIGAQVPAISFVVYDIRDGKSHFNTNLKVSKKSIENSIYKITLDNNGDISSIIDKRYGKELVKFGKSIRLALFTENESFSWPAWEILKKTIDSEPVSITGNVKITVAENGPIRGSICVERTYNESTFKQYLCLTEGVQDDRIDFVSEIDWHTTNALLKAEFPLTINNKKATYDLGIGQIQRGNNTKTAYEVYAQYWADLTEPDQTYGVSVLNNSKYGWDKPDNNTLRLTLLHTPKTQNGYSYQNKQDFGYHTFTYSLFGHGENYTTAKTVWKAEILNQPLKAFTTTKHKGEWGKSFTFATTNSDQVILKALKKSKNSDSYVVRFYETTGKNAIDMEMAFAGQIVEAFELDGTEEFKGKACFEGNKLKYNINPFSIKTFSVKLEPAKKQLTAASSFPVSLKYNFKTSTFNYFRSEANFDGKGNSYAAELFPETLVSDGVKFKFGEKAVKNGLRCEGDTIVLPQGGNYTKIYFLAASVYGNNQADFKVDNFTANFTIPYYSGFIGQWEHTGHTEGFLQPQQVAFVGTHKHSMINEKDVPYEFTYMFKFGMDIPKNAKRLILPKNSRIVLFAVSLAKNTADETKIASDLIYTSLKSNRLNVDSFVRKNLIVGKPVVGCSGIVNESEKAENAIDRDFNTKWCDASDIRPKFIEIDLQKQDTIRGWFVSHAALESMNYITKEYNLEVKKDLSDSWFVVDRVVNNADPETDRLLKSPVVARYIRLTIIKPDQDEGSAARIYEFDVY